MITSAHNPRLQHIRALLTQRKDRQQFGEVAVEGVRLVEEAIAASWQPRFLLYTDELSERGTAIVDASRTRGVEVEGVLPKLLKAVVDTENPQGLVGVFTMRSLPFPARPTFLLVADAVRDPGNLGTLLRTAAAAGVQGVLLAPGTADPFNPKALRSGMGAHFRLPLLTLTWEAIATACRPATHIYLAEAAQGVPCWQADLRRPVTVIVGGEAEGAGLEARALADDCITIPMPGQSESLNAAVAASILLFEVVRQRNAG
jgi:RNA methyltransferase, TrmH family